MDNINIYDARIRGGAALAKSYPAEADLVCGVRIPVFLRQRASLKPQGSPSALLSIKTAM